MRVRFVVSGLVCAATLAATLAACSEKQRESETSKNAPIDQPAGADLSTGEVSITTKGGALVMGLRHDSVLVAFSDSIRESVRDEINKVDKSKEAKDGLGSMIEGIVKKSVAAGLGEVFDKARGFPVSDLKDVRYEAGSIVFDFNKRPTFSFIELKENNEPFLSHFAPADAERFVSAVRVKLPDAQR